MNYLMDQLLATKIQSSFSDIHYNEPSIIRNKLVASLLKDYVKINLGIFIYIISKF